MKFLLFIIGFLASTLFAEMFDDSDVSYSYDIEMNDDDSVIKYLVDTTYYDQFSAEVLGVYVFYKDVPIKIIESTNIMAQILNRFINLRKNPHSYANLRLHDEYKRFLDINLFQKFSQKHYNHHIELRNIELMLKDSSRKLTLNNIRALYNAVNEYILKKKDFYGRQNNEDGVAFCNVIEKILLQPLLKLGYKLKSNQLKANINDLSKDELKLTWNNFKESELSIVQTFFESNKARFRTINKRNIFNIPLNEAESNKYKYYYLCINIFGQTWYLELYDDYTSDVHKVSLIKL